METNQEKEKTGITLAVSGLESLISVNEKIYRAFLRGSLKQERVRKNLLVPGDRVTIQLMEEDQGVILSIHPRRSLLSRSAERGRKEQLIAANVDQVMIVGSLARPPLNVGLLDRYALAAEEGGMTPLFLINKADLRGEATPEERALLSQIQEIYPKLGYSIYLISAHSQEGIEDLRKAMAHKVSCFVGESGTGKSSLLNQVCGLSLKVGELMRQGKKGAHTTTRATMIPLEGEGFCVDTPGIRHFGLWQLTREALARHFREITAHSGGCHYPNCSHTHEPECAVKEALSQGEVSQIRYRSYTSLLKELRPNLPPKL